MFRDVYRHDPSRCLRLGILKGGQLGRMLMQACMNYDLQGVVMDKDPQSPCAHFCSEFISGDCCSYDDVYRFGKMVDVLTLEVEEVNVEALKQLESASERRQWFGKIGTNADDLRAATLISLAQGLRARNNILKTKIDPPIGEWLSDRKEIISNQIRSWWLFRRARQILAEDLSDFEDLYVRNTDSMIEYHTLGDALTGIPTKTLKEKIKKEEEADNRTNAHTYYKAYLAQNYLARWQRSEGLKVLDEALVGNILSLASDS